MRKLFLYCLLSIATFSSAQENEVLPFPMEENALLWEIKGNGIKKRAYIFGTMHLIEKEYFLFPKKLEKLVSKSDVLVMELDGISNQSAAMEFVMLPENESFFDFFNQAQTDSIFQWVQERFMMDSSTVKMTFNRLKPFVVSQMAVQMAFAGKTESYEMTLEQLANDGELEIIGLETIAFQMSLFDNLTKDQQTELVMASIRNTNDDIDLTQRMMQMYARQNVDSLYLLLEDEGVTISEEQEQFLDQRNKNWIPLIEDIIQTKSAFIAVGAGHLGGPQGILRLLQKEGYQLKPIRL